MAFEICRGFHRKSLRRDGEGGEKDLGGSIRVSSGGVVKALAQNVVRKEHPAQPDVSEDAFLEAQDQVMWSHLSLPGGGNLLSW